MSRPPLPFLLPRAGAARAAVDRSTDLSGGRLDELLETSSRTFALAIPRLPEPTRRQVGIAYLLFRIADTFEDADRWPREWQLAALARFGLLLRNPAALEEARQAAAGWLAAPPSDHAGYLELLAATPAVLGAFGALDGAAHDAIEHHTRRTLEGMATFVARREGGVLELADLADLRRYCYVVAGIVGEMLTELFLLGRPGLAPIAERLRRDAARFGEALQLVNIVKDAASDRRAGRSFLPPGCDRADVFALARDDLRLAAGYVHALQSAGAPRGVVAFTALPVRLARATLDRVEEDGPGSKISRPRVFAIVRALDEALDAGTPAAGAEIEVPSG